MLAPEEGRPKWRKSHRLRLTLLKLVARQIAATRISQGRF